MVQFIHIAHLISPQKLYGKEKWLLALLKHIDRDEFHSTVVMLTDEGGPPLADALDEEGIAYVIVPCGMALIYKSVAEVAGIVQGQGVDILHTHDYRADIVGYATARRTGSRIIGTPHGWSNAPDVKLQAYQVMDKLLLPFFDRVVPLSPQLHRGLRRYCRRNLRMIRNFIDVSGLPAPRAAEAALISFIGRLTWLKRAQDAITALRFTRDASIRLQIIGDGPLRGRMENLAERLDLRSRISFLGFREDALDLLNRSTALVVPSLTEGISRVAMEAMALGKPVIGTDIPGIRTLVDPGRTGMLVPRKDPRLIARAIDELLGNRAMYAAMSEAARMFVLREHAADVVVREYEALYRETAAT